MEIPNEFLVNDYKRKVSAFVPVVIFDYIQMQQMLMGDLKLLTDNLERLRIYIRDTTKYGWDSPIFRFSNIYGTEFAFQIYIVADTATIHVWDYRGNTGVFDGVLDNVIQQRKKTMDTIFEICEKWTAGQIMCSDCHKWIDYIENKKHIYFAGVFCSSCWETKWKAIEAKENYN